MLFRLEAYKEILCEKCGRLVRYKDLPKLTKDVATVAIDHGDHFLLVKYDKYGIVRGADIYDKTHGEGEIAVEVTCPRCGKKEKVYGNSLPFQLAIDHGEHALVINVIDVGLHLLDTYPIVKIVGRGIEEDVNWILNRLGVEKFASLLADLVLFEKKRVFVPKSIIQNVENLFSYLGFPSAVIAPGMVAIQDERYMDYFKKILEFREGRLDLEKLKRSMYLLKALAQTIVNKLDNKNEVRNILENMKNSEVFDIVIISIKNNYSEEVVRKLENALRYVR
ncbi:MAG: hypothetical protein ACP6IP_03080 [Candidatus Njordarchaeia archaeon]